MSKYFVLPETNVGPGGQIYFRNGHPEYNWYNVFLDDIKIGKVMNTTIRRRVRWAGLSYADDSEFFGTRMLDGFASRFEAATFIIKHNGYWMMTEREHVKDEARTEKFLYNWNMKKSHEIMNGVDF